MWLETLASLKWYNLPILAAIGFYLILRAQLRWFDEPYLSSRETAEMAFLGMFLVFVQGWFSRRRDWTAALEHESAQHLLGSRLWWLALIGIAIAVQGAWQGINQEEWFATSVVIKWLVALILVLTARYFAEWQSVWWRHYLPVIKWGIAVAGIWLCLYAAWKAVFLEDHVVTLLQWWVGGIGLTVFGLIPNQAWLQWVRYVSHSMQQDWREWLTVLGLLGLALIARLAWLGSEPHIQSDDEAAFAIQAVDLVSWSKWIDNPFRYGSWQAHPFLYHLTQLASIQTLGQTVFAARVPSALMGAFTVPALYLMGRRLFNWRVALAAAIFLLTFPQHLHFSRLALNQVGDPLFAVLSFAFITRALRTGDKVEFGLAGVSLGLSQYFYSSMIVPLLITGYVGVYAVLRPGWLRRYADLLAITIAVAAVVAFPLYYSNYKDEERSLSPRLDRVAIFKTGDIQLQAAAAGDLKEYWEFQFANAFGAYVFRLDESGFYGTHNSVMGWYGGVPFMIGVALCLRRWWDPRWIILPLWVGVAAILGGAMLVDPPHFTRYASVVPGLALLVGVGLAYIVEMIQDFPQQLDLKAWPILSDKRLQTVVLAGVVFVFAGLNLWDYTEKFLPQRLYFGERTAKLNEVAWTLQDLDLEDREIYYFSDADLNLTGSSLMRYQVKRRGQEYIQPPEEIHNLPAGDYIFVAAPLREEEFVALAEEVPWGETKTFTRDNDDEVLIYVLFVTLDE